MRSALLAAAVFAGLTIVICSAMATRDAGAAPKQTSSTSAASNPASTPQTQMEDAIRAVVKAFEKHSVVIIGEDHLLRQAGDFYNALVRDPEFQKVCNDVVVEFASAQNQPLLDRYINGEDIPIEQVRRIWRDTSKVASWESAIYQNWLAAIRDVNKKLPKESRLRALAGDTPVDWDKIQTKEDYAALGHNNPSFVKVIREQVLDKKRKCLLVIGNGHVPRNGDKRLPDKSSVVTMLEKSNPGSTYVFAMLNAFGPANIKDIDDKLSDVKPPAAMALKGTWMADLSGWGGRFDEVADAVLYMGPKSSLKKVRAPKGTVDQAYIKESERRAMLEWGHSRFVADLLREE